MAQRTTDELRVFLEGSIDQYNALTDKAGTVFFDKANHAVYAKGECIIQSNIKDVTYNETSTELTITPFTGSKITINLGIQKELDLLKDNLEDWVADNFASTTILSTELDKKVDKVSGKGLSTNDYTDGDKNKLDGIENGAQVNKISSFKANNTEVGGAGNGVTVSLSGNLVDSSSAATGNVGFNLSHKYYPTANKIRFFKTATPPDVYNEATHAKDVIFTIDTSDFVQAGMINKVEYNSVTGELNITFPTIQTDGTLKDTTVKVDLSKLVDVYKAGNGLTATVSDDGTTFTAVLGNGLAFDANNAITLSLGSGLSIDNSGKLVVDFAGNCVTSINGMGGGAYTINSKGVTVGTYGHAFRPVDVVGDQAAKKLEIRANPKDIFAQFFHENSGDATSGIRAVGVEITENETDSLYSMLMDFTPKVWSF